MEERCNIEGTDGNLLQNIIFKSFFSVFRLDGVFQDTKVEWRVLVCFRDKLEKLPLRSWEIEQFSSFSPILPLVLP